jgi:hypothetical protein
MRDEIGFIRRQHGTEKSQVLEFTKFGEWRPDVIAERHRERRMTTKEAEKNQVIVVDRATELASLEQHGVQRIAADKALVAPDGHEAAIVALRGPRQPIAVLAAFAAAIHERAGENIVILQSTIPPVPGTDAPQFTGKRSQGLFATKAFYARSPPAVCFNLTGRADFHVQRVRILDVPPAAFATDREE